MTIARRALALVAAASALFSAGPAGAIPPYNHVALPSITTPVSLANGGSGNALTADNGAMVYSDASGLRLLAHTATANLPLLSGSSTAPAWAALGYPTAATQGGVIYSTASALAVAAAGTSGQLLQSNGTAAPGFVSDLIPPGNLTLGAAKHVIFTNGAEIGSDGTNGDFCWYDTSHVSQACVIFNAGQFLWRNGANNAYLGMQALDIQSTNGSTIKWDVVPSLSVMRQASDFEQRWSSTTTQSGTADIGLKRSAAGVACATNGAGTCTGRLQTGPTGSASLDYGATAAGTCDSLTVTVTGAADGDPVHCGIPTALAFADTYAVFYSAVSSANTVTVKRCNITNLTTALSNPAAATVTCTVSK